jgi:hypothetical protein
MSRELKIAYPLLIRQWELSRGHVTRLRPPGVKGIPDFLLTCSSLGNVLCEVKCVEDGADDIGLDVMQAVTLDSIHQFGGSACVVAFDLHSKLWAGFSAGWLEIRMREKKQIAWNRGRIGLSITPEYIASVLGVGMRGERRL